MCCVNVSSAGAMLVVLNRAPKGKLSIVLKAPVEASMLCLTGRSNLPPQNAGLEADALSTRSPSIEETYLLGVPLKILQIFWNLTPSATEVEQSTLFETNALNLKMLATGSGARGFGYHCG